MKRTAAIAFAVACVVASGPARAEVTAGASYLWSDSKGLSDHDGVDATVGSRIAGPLEVRGELWLNDARLSNLAENIRQTFRYFGSGDDLSGSGAVPFALLATGALTLAEGTFEQLPALSSVRLSATASAGLSSVHYSAILTCSENLKSLTRCPNDSFRSWSGWGPLFGGGLELRLGVWRQLSVDLGLRTVAVLNENYVNVDFKNPVGTGTLSTDGWTLLGFGTAGLAWSFR